MSIIHQISNKLRVQIAGFSGELQLTIQFDDIPDGRTCPVEDFRMSSDEKIFPFAGSPVFFSSWSSFFI